MDSGQLTQRIEPLETSSSYRWVVMLLWLFCSVSGFVAVSTIGIILPDISEELDLSPGEQGVVSSAAFWGNFALAIPLSWWASRYGPKLLTTVTLAAGSLCLLLQGWAPVFAVLLAGRLLFGFTVLAREPARALLMRRWFRGREIIWVNSIGAAMFGVGVGGGLVATPYILDLFGDNWRAVLYSFGGYFGVITVLWMAVAREQVPEGGRSEGSRMDLVVLFHTLSYRDLWVTGFGFLGVTLTWSAFISFFPTLMLDNHEISLRWSGAILALGIFVGGIAGLGAGYIVNVADRRKLILQVLGVLMAGTYAGMALAGSIPLQLLLSFLNGIAWGFWPILYTVPFQLPGISARETAVGIAFIMTMVSAGSVAGPLIAGFVEEVLEDLEIGLLVASVPALLLTGAGIFLRPDSESSVAEGARKRVKHRPGAGV